jgi:hypothetical protein
MARRVAAFLDVLGFKQLVKHVPHEELVVLYKALMDTVYEHTTLTSYPDDHRKWDEDPYYDEHEVKQLRFVKMMIASDSIVLFSDDDGSDGARRVLSAVKRLLVAGFRLGTPLRGAVTVGDLDLVEGTDVAESSTRNAWALGLVGAGLVRAYELEGGFAWSGAVIEPDLVEQLANDIMGTAGDGGTMSALDLMCVTGQVTNAEELLGRVVQGDDTAAHRCVWVVNWPDHLIDGQPALTEQLVYESFESHGRGALTDRVQDKRRHTLEYWAEVKSRRGQRPALAPERR